ncbi:MAG: alkyl hydroperoxide reductase subunit F [Muribaculaceae bacterium]|nr:alkyl hydroperoxide reductase subunit F [Muribaculaceae bacterium]
MLDNTIKEQLKAIFANLDSDIALRLCVKGGSPQAPDEITGFLNDVASSSPRLSVEIADCDVAAPVFEIIKNGIPTGIRFCGIPNGHEFTTLLLAILNADGQGKNMPDETLCRRIKALKGPVELQTFVSLTCTNCPEVAQALNIIALLNPEISNTVIDGAVVQQLVETLNIQSVPTVYADNRLLSVGRSTLGDLLGKLEAIYGTTNNNETAPMTHRHDVVVIGGGPAGAAAAVYCARKGFKTAIVAKTIGGQVKETMKIENLISVPETTGPQLAADLKEHISRYPIDIFENRTVESADISGKEKVIISDANETFRCKALIIATGASWRKLSIPGESEHLGHGVAFCTHCDGPFYAGRHVAVVGGGNSGIEAAIDMAALCPHVDVFEFTDTIKADRILKEKATSMPNIDIHVSSQVVAIEGDGKNVSGIRVKDRISGIETIYPVSGVFVQIGLVPNSRLFQHMLPVTTSGEIIVDRWCRTSVKGVYASGDVTDTPYKQIIVAMGEGAKAALSLSEDSMHGILD